MSLTIYILDLNKSIGTHQEQILVHAKKGMFLRKQWVGKNNSIEIWQKLGTSLTIVLIILQTLLSAPSNAILNEKFESELNQSVKTEQVIDYKELGFKTQLESKTYLAEIIERNSIKKEIGKDWSYNEKVMFANFIKLANDDILQTAQKANGPNGSRYVENNPFVRPFVNSPTLFRAGGFIGQAYLAQRWQDMDSTQRTIEILAANIIEAGALHYSDNEPFQLTFGIDFDV
jgi:hypothetical protein